MKHYFNRTGAFTVVPARRINENGTPKETAQKTHEAPERQAEAPKASPEVAAKYWEKHRALKAKLDQYRKSDNPRLRAIGEKYYDQFNREVEFGYLDTPEKMGNEWLKKTSGTMEGMDKGLKAELNASEKTELRASEKVLKSFNKNSDELAAKLNKWMKSDNPKLRAIADKYHYRFTVKVMGGILDTPERTSDAVLKELIAEMARIRKDFDAEIAGSASKKEPERPYDPFNEL